MDTKNINTIHVLEQFEKTGRNGQEFYYVILCSKDGENQVGRFIAVREADQLAQKISKETNAPIQYFGLESGQLVERESMEDLVTKRKQYEDETINKLHPSKVFLLAIVIAVVVLVVKVLNGYDIFG